MENVDVSSEYSSSIEMGDGTSPEPSFNSIAEKLEAIANEGVVSADEPEGEAPAEQEAEAENAEQVEATEHDETPGEGEGEAEAADAPEVTEPESPLASIKAQIESGDLSAEDITKELGLSVTSKQITQLAQEMSKAKELQREAKKGAELVAQAREIVQRAQKSPIELLSEIAGPNFIDNYLMERAGMEPEEKAQQEQPDFEQMFAQKAEERRQAEIASLVTPWVGTVSTAAETAEAPNAVRILGSRQALAKEAQSLVDQVAINREEELGRSLTPMEAYQILNDWTPEKVISTLEAEASKRLGVSEESGAVSGSLPSEPATPPQQPTKKPQTLTGDMVEQSANPTPDLDKYSNDRDRLNAFMKNKHLKP